MDMAVRPARVGWFVAEVERRFAGLADRPAAADHAAKDRWRRDVGRWPGGGWRGERPIERDGNGSSGPRLGPRPAFGGGLAIAVIPLSLLQAHLFRFGALVGVWSSGSTRPDGNEALGDQPMRLADPGRPGDPHAPGNLADRMILVPQQDELRFPIGGPLAGKHPDQPALQQSFDDLAGIPGRLAELRRDLFGRLAIATRLPNPKQALDGPRPGGQRRQALMDLGRREPHVRAPVSRS